VKGPGHLFALDQVKEQILTGSGINSQRLTSACGTAGLLERTKKTLLLLRDTELLTGDQRRDDPIDDKCPIL
jgi:hypothetical protein